MEFKKQFDVFTYKHKTIHLTLSPRQPAIAGTDKNSVHPDSPLERSFQQFEFCRQIFHKQKIKYESAASKSAVEVVNKQKWLENGHLIPVDECFNVN